MADDDLQNVLAEELQHSEATREEPLPRTGVRARSGRARVFSIRLDPDDIETIEQIARRMDVPTTALVRGWVLRGMAEHGDESLASAVERVRVDLERVRELLG